MTDPRRTTEFEEPIGSQVLRCPAGAAIDSQYVYSGDQEELLARFPKIVVDALVGGPYHLKPRIGLLRLTLGECLTQISYINNEQLAKNWNEDADSEANFARNLAAKKAGGMRISEVVEQSMRDCFGGERLHIRGIYACSPFTPPLPREVY